jgi:N-acyl-D-amino-acid deacylase
VAKHDGFYASHIRNEGVGVLDAVAEAIRVGREGELPVQVSHLKAAGRPNWGKVADALMLIDAAQGEGLDVMGDVYPYTASSTSLGTLLPDWALEGGIPAMLKRLHDPTECRKIREEMARGGGYSIVERMGWENVMIAWCPKRPDAEGRRVSEIAAARRLEPIEAVFEVLRDADGVASMILFQLDERDLLRALAHPQVMIGSDGSALAVHGELAAGKPHPRNYGTFPRVLGHYARDERAFGLAEAVHKMTGLPARRLGLRDRGELRVATWDEALDRAAAGLQRAMDRNPGWGAGLFSCSKATNEMNFVAQKFARQVLGTNNIDSCNRT